jgi:glycosyltransferase involved in cell wall biosynthesis
MTYNHAKYIKNTFDGFCMQQTKFPFICTIIDDASIDNEPEVINNYLAENFDLEDTGIVRHEDAEDFKLSFAQHKTNKNCFFAVLFLKYNHYQIKKSKIPYVSRWRNSAKYIAICEGDDYWIDPMKLQKQVDFMEAHPKHSLCFCANQRLLPSGETTIEKRYLSNLDQCPMEDIILGGGGYMATNSMLYRQSLYIPYSTWAVGCPIGDLPLMLTLAYNGLVGYLTDVMCVYRVSAVGSWSKRMASNIRTRRIHYHAIVRMWRQFDVWSNRKYHKTIREKIRINRRNHIKDELSTLKTIITKK